MLRRLSAAIAAALSLAATPELAAQRGSLSDSILTPHGVCRVWTGIPGGSTYPDDRAYAQCALDGRAVLRSDPALPQPVIDPYMGGDFTVIINADGTVHPGLTGAWSTSMDSAAHRRTLETLRAWRFQPGMRDGAAVRSGIRLQVVAGQRNDTVPSRLTWTYHPAPFGDDTLRGTWATLPPAPPLTPAQRDSAYAALFRRLLQMRVIAPAPGRSYCLVREDGGDPRVLEGTARMARMAASRAGNGTPGDFLAAGDAECGRGPGRLRLSLGRLHATEDGRIVLYPAGDSLWGWPPGPRAATYASWAGRCVILAPAGAPASADCGILPTYEAAATRRASEPDPAPRRYAPGDSIRLTVVAMTRGAFQADTLSAVVHDLPRISRSAVLAPVSEACARSWNAFTQQDSAELYAVMGLRGEGDDWFVTRLQHRRPPPAPRAACAPATAKDSAVILFILGGVGDRVRQPVTFCLGDELCAQRYQLDPARHTLAKDAHLRLRVANLREETRAGEQVILQISADPLPEGLLPLVMVRRPGSDHVSLFSARRTAPATWTFDVVLRPVLAPDSEISIYLVAR